MKATGSRNVICVIMAVLLAIMPIMQAAFCESAAWDCPGCGKTGNTGNFCGNCAHPRPDTDPADGSPGSGQTLTSASAESILPDNPSESTQSQASPPAKTNSFLLENIKAGNIVVFGHYEQDNSADNGNEEIEWVVLEVRDEKALLISKYILDAMPYEKNGTSAITDWVHCSLREWLNGDFLNTAFTTEEQAAILTTNVDNSSGQSAGGKEKWRTDSSGYIHSGL